ncbi:MAG: 23S rRNA (cytosine(2499)-C(5))-methyltransferase [Anaerolineae bacterium]
MKRLALHVTRHAERALREGHPWLFDQSITKQNQDGQPGDLAVIFDHKNRFLAIGLYDPVSPIRVKVLHHTTSTQINRAWFIEKIAQAVLRRAPLMESETNGYRLIHGENDGLPGLVVDRYADTLVIKLYSAAWIPHVDDVIVGLQAAQPHHRLVLRLNRQMQQAPELNNGLVDGQILTGDPLDEPIVIQENGLRFYADVVHGHKTGFFFDQRDNRAFAGKLARGRRVLDVYAYAGAFSLYAASGGAQQVLSLDISAPALVDAQKNFALNQEHPAVAAAQHDILVADAFEGLRQLHTEGRSFNMVIVDPPSFAKSAEEVDRALVAYRQLTELALNVLEPQGVFVMASCSSRVSAEVFFHTVHGAASQAGRLLMEQRRTAHALDHPIGFPEGAYLKCLFATTID